ncbi:unnamed protein product [Rhizophagus irregularis]|nr:unnamed protein product [Rhizophagus irregularis]
MAYQLSCAISCLHKEGIVHRDLHSREQYDIGLALDISQGYRETVVPDTPDEYAKIYTECWDGEPDNRPTIYQVVDWLNSIITKTDVIVENHQISNEQELNEELTQLIQNFDKINIKEIDPMDLNGN